MSIHRSVQYLIPFLTAGVVAGCSAKHGLRSPIREVDGLQYFIAEGMGQRTAMPDFSKRLAWQAALTQLARSRSTQVYEHMTRELQGDVDKLIKRRGIQGWVTLVDEVTSRVPLRNVHELRVRDGGEYVTVVLGIPMAVWEELVDEAAEEVEQQLRTGVIDLEASRRRERP